MLIEGTFQKYVLKNEEVAKKLLQLVVDAAEIVIKSGKYAIATPFREVFGPENLLRNSEAIIVHVHDGTNVKHCVASYQNGNEGQGPAAKSAHVISMVYETCCLFLKEELPISVQDMTGIPNTPG